MAKTKDKLYDTADTMRPYVDRALHDDDLHDNLKEAFAAARDVYAELLGNPQPDVNRDARRDRQGHSGQPQEARRGARARRRTGSRARQTTAPQHDAPARGITVGILFNPMTGPQTRKWLMEKVDGRGMRRLPYTPPVEPASQRAAAET
jgi:hypothetical protein